jgi:hypothetical protein
MAHRGQRAVFLVTLINRFALSAPAQRFVVQAAVDRYAASQRQSLYFSVTFWLWTSEQIMVLAFGIALFFALRVSHRTPRNRGRGKGIGL